MSNGTWEETLAWLNAQVGYHEEGRTNRQKYAKMAGHLNGYAWCASFVSAAMLQNGVPVPRQVLVPSSRRMFDQASMYGLVLRSVICPGDVAHMPRGARNLYLGHVGVVIALPGNDMVRTIEGNTNSRGSATGGSVLIHERKISEWMLGFWRPPYRKWVAPPKTLWAWKGGIGVPITEKTAHLIGTPSEVQNLLNQGWIFGTPPKELTWVR